MLHDMEQEDGESLSVEQFKAALYAAIQLLGNASAQVSRLRRKKILKSINPEIQDLAEEIFLAAAPYLFWWGLWTKDEGQSRVSENPLLGQTSAAN